MPEQMVRLVELDQEAESKRVARKKRVHGEAPLEPIARAMLTCRAFCQVARELKLLERFVGVDLRRLEMIVDGVAEEKLD